MTTSREHATWKPWTYRVPVGTVGGDRDLVGFDLEAADGGIGTIDEATYDVGASYVVVDTGAWIFGTRTMLPAGTITRVDRERRTVHVARTRNEIKDAPRLPKGTGPDQEYRNRLAAYYGRFRDR